FGTYKLGTPGSANLSAFVAENWYKTLFGRPPDFMMLNRLTEYLIRNEGQLKKALQLTYQFVFVDEFQDTTFSQYDLVSTIIQCTGAAVTAVGDNKQRIMVWAGAKPDSFSSFFTDFRAAKHTLLANYRSAPELVRIQNCLALELEPGSQKTISAALPLIDENVAAIWNFQDPSSEFSYLANWLVADQSARNLAPQDYAILVRQKPDDFHASLSKAFSHAGIEICNQAQKLGKTTMQDLLSDEFFQFLAGLIRLSVSKRTPRAWTLCSEVIDVLFSPSENNSSGPSLDSILDRVEPIFLRFDDAATRLCDFFETVIDCLGEETIREAFPDLTNKDNYAIFVDAFYKHAAACASNATDWNQFVDYFEAAGQIPLLTVHKSKGLEYDTVVFIGLDDDSWWSYPSSSAEGNATFFVALSRAKQRVIFTYSKGANGRQKVSDLYRLLKDAGVPEQLIEAK
ncbi:MAG: ATP-dependent helicase, partial [Candidatus Obscuribacterales bacterium]|nr:ATP-dependent helicase [Candidatus Obscuribacterales bacterium]